MKRYNIVGAFDRHNYGDILFPLIHTRYISENTKGEENIEVMYYSLSQSDLTSIGGVVTMPLKALLSSSPQENDRVIMCGGDILTVDWISMIGHLSNRSFYFLLRQVRKILGSVLANDFIRILYGQKNKYPYVLCHDDIGAKIFYTAVGGSGFGLRRNKYINAIPARLKMINSLSVRERVTQQNLMASGVSCNLVPDTALIMSDVFPLHELNALDWKDKIESVGTFDSDNYFVFQAARDNIEEHLEEVENEIRTIIEATNQSILLLPIGRATGHEDHIVLEWLYKKLAAENLPVAIQNSEHVLHIMSSLAHAKAYIGTSLHGAITAYSFGHKVCAFSTREVKKLQSYLDTWFLATDFYSTMGVNFSSGFIALVEVSCDINNDTGLNMQKEMVYVEMDKYL